MRFRRLILGLTLIACATISASADRARLPDLGVPAAFGVNIHFTDPKPGEAKMLADAGFKWIRMDFAWGAVERTRGAYDFAAYERLLAALQPHGVRAVFILDYANRLYDDGVSPHTDESRAAMAAFAAAAVTHFKGRGVVWEMWNEPNIAQFWKPRPNADDYAKLALAVAKAIRAAAPDELHVGPATSTIDLPFLETCFNAGLLDYWDAVSVHPYRRADPETACDDYRKLRLLIARHAPKGKTIPILSGEWGYSSAWASFDVARQAKYLPRQFLTNLYNEIPISIWYDWHDDGQDPKEGEHHFGAVHHPYRRDADPVYDPKPAYVAMKTLAEQLGGFSYNKRIALDSDDDWLLLFARGDDVRLAAWTRDKTPHEILIPASAASVFDFVTQDGRPSGSWTVLKSAAVLRVTDSVQYVIPRAPDPVLIKAAKWERLPLEFALTAPAAEPGILDRAADVGRGDESHPRRAKLSRQGADPIEQQTTVLITNPIRFNPLPMTDAALWFQVDNPSGEPFDCQLFGPDVPGRYDSFWAKVRLSRGQARALVATSTYADLVDASRRSNRYNVRYDVDTPDFRNPLSQKPEVTFTALADFVSPRADASKLFTLTADGDNKLRSEQSLALADAPEPLPTGGRRALKLTYAFPAGWKFVELKPATDDLKMIDGKPKALALWLFGDASGHRLRVRFRDAAGQTFQPDGRRVDFKGWQYLTIPLTGDLHHWGKGDGLIHYPVRWETLLLLDNESHQKSAGEIWIAAPTLVE